MSADALMTVFLSLSGAKNLIPSQLVPHADLQGSADTMLINTALKYNKSSGKN
jgi:hypothetical protein